MTERIADWRITDPALQMYRERLNHKSKCDCIGCRLVLDYVDARAELERCSDYVATLGVENEQLRACVKELEDGVGGQKSVVNTAGLIMAQTKSGDAGELLDKYNTLRDAVQAYLTAEDIFARKVLKHQSYPDYDNRLTDYKNRRAILDRILTEGGGDETDV